MVSQYETGGRPDRSGPFPGDYPRCKWERFTHAIPKDLSGKTVLDIGCNAGFYSIEMKRRGADRVVAIDFDERYLAQARLAAEVLEAEIEFQQLSVYEIGRLEEKFDVVLFMGVFYHLRHPLLALDLIRQHAARDLLVFQSMIRGEESPFEAEADYDFTNTQPFENPAFPRMYFIERKYAGDPTNWWAPNRSCVEAMLRSAGFHISGSSRERGFPVPGGKRRLGCSSRNLAFLNMPVEAIMFWNEPNNKSHWDFEIDPEWDAFSAMVNGAVEAVAEENPGLTKVLGGISPIDPAFIQRLDARGVIERMDAVAVHGFPLDWNHWQIHEWPARLEELAAATDLPIWVSEVGVSSFGAEEVQEFGLQRTAELLSGKAPRVHWYSLYDLPRAWPATTRHREAEGSSYYRHFYMGLLREDGTPKRALTHFSRYTPGLGICQWFHFEDHRLESAVRWFRDLGVRRLRTGLSWADSFRPGALEWFDHQMQALEEFDVTLTFCFTPEHLGIAPHHTSPPKEIEGYAEFCRSMVRRYAPRGKIQPVSDYGDLLSPSACRA